MCRLFHPKWQLDSAGLSLSDSGQQQSWQSDLFISIGAFAAKKVGLFSLNPQK